MPKLIHSHVRLTLTAANAGLLNIDIGIIGSLTRFPMKTKGTIDSEPPTRRTYAAPHPNRGAPLNEKNISISSNTPSKSTHERAEKAHSPICLSPIVCQLCEYSTPDKSYEKPAWCNFFEEGECQISLEHRLENWLF